MIHYHGTPVTPRAKILDLAGRHFCVSFANPRDVRTVHEIGQSVMLDNGAFTFWNDGVEAPYWPSFEEWAEPWLDFPTTWCVIPDEIDGDELANDALVRAFRHMRKAAPVWHLHESIERLQSLTNEFERVCFGSSGAYREIGTDRWHRRISEAFDAISDPSGRVPWIHMLRGLDLAGSHYPFASADSTNVARNHAGSHRQRPFSIAAKAAEVDSRQCPARWARVGTQERILA